jgi:hypothetical protein
MAPAQPTRKVYRIRILGSALASEGAGPTPGPHPRVPSSAVSASSATPMEKISSPSFAGARGGRSACLVSLPSWFVCTWT